MNLIVLYNRRSRAMLTTYKNLDPEKAQKNRESFAKNLESQRTKNK